MDKCKACGAPVRYMPPDGDLKYDPPPAPRALAPPVPQGSGEGWHPIETAPKDGTPVLLVGDDDDPLTVVIGKRGDDPVTPDCFSTNYGNWWPTHWQPLPAPPVPGASE